MGGALSEGRAARGGAAEGGAGASEGTATVMWASEDLDTFMMETWPRRRASLYSSSQSMDGGGGAAGASGAAGAAGAEGAAGRWAAGSKKLLLANHCCTLVRLSLVGRDARISSSVACWWSRRIDLSNSWAV